MAAQFCPFCGKPVTAAGATFCAFCGRSLSDQSSPSPTPPPAQSAPPPPAQAVPPPPLPPGANPPGMVAVPMPNTPVAGPPPAGVATGPAYYQAPPPAYGAGYPPPGYAAPPLGYGAYGTYAAPAYPLGASARPAFSTARAVWCAIAVVVVAIGVGIGIVYNPFYSQPYLFARFGISWILRPALFPIAFGTSSGYWLGLARLQYKTPWQALVEVTGINVALLLVFLGIAYAVARVVHLGGAFAIFDLYLGLDTYIGFYSGLLLIMAISVLGALVASVIGVGIAHVFANWAVVRMYPVGHSSRTQLSQTFGGICSAFFLFLVATLLYGRVSEGFFAFVGVVVLIIRYLPLIIMVILLALAATWSALRLLRRSVAASPVPAAPVPVAPGA